MSANSEINQLEKWINKFLDKVQAERKQQMQDLQTSVVRTAVPYLVSGVITLLTIAGVNASDGLVAGLTALAAFLVGTAYYLIVRMLETRWPKLGWLLGKPTQPTYKAGS